jgi:hypothetical protein
LVFPQWRTDGAMSARTTFIRLGGSLDVCEISRASYHEMAVSQLRADADA